MTLTKSGCLKAVLIILVIGGAFLYGFAFRAYHIFPHQQLMQAKHYMEHRFGLMEEEVMVEAEDIDMIETVLQRLLIKKIKLDIEIVHGGAMVAVDDILYILSNKGELKAIDLTAYSDIELNSENVPLRYDEVIASGIPYQGDFRYAWFRVNGAFAEKNDRGGHTLFVSHQQFHSEQECFTYTISKMDIDYQENQVRETSGWETLFQADPCIPMVPDVYMTEFPAFVGNVSGGKIAHYDSNTLLVSVGDYDRHGLREGIEAYAQNPDVPYGKFILVNKQTGEWERYTMGNRNPSGLYIDEDGTIWSTENGPQGGDELNIIERGKNYGWPVVSLGLWYHHEYHFSDDYIRGSHADYKKPVYSWAPSIALSNLIKIEGGKFKHWKGDLLVGTYKDQSLQRLRLDDDNRVIYNEPIHLGHRVRDITTLPNESIALITDDNYLIILDDGGGVYSEMGPAEMNRVMELNRFDRLAGEQSVLNDERTAGSFYEQHCAACHSLQNENRLGPHLNGLFERTVGEVDEFRYSGTLRADSRVWSPDLFREFLKNPDESFRGTNMSEIELSDSEIDSLIQFIQ